MTMTMQKQIDFLRRVDEKRAKQDKLDRFIRRCRLLAEMMIEAMGVEPDDLTVAIRRSPLRPAEWVGMSEDADGNPVVNSIGEPIPLSDLLRRTWDK